MIPVGPPVNYPQPDAWIPINFTIKKNENQLNGSILLLLKIYQRNGKNNKKSRG